LGEVVALAIILSTERGVHALLEYPAIEVLLLHVKPSGTAS
jgi:hypothetical protein